MADRISIIYDANVDALKAALDEIIRKNVEVRLAVAETKIAITTIANALKEYDKRIQININNIQDYSQTFKETNTLTVKADQVTKAYNETIKKSAEENKKTSQAAKDNAKAEGENAKANDEATNAKKRRSQATKVETNNITDNSIALTTNNKLNIDLSTTIDKSAKTTQYFGDQIKNVTQNIQNNQQYVKTITDSYNRYYQVAASAIDGISSKTRSSGSSVQYLIDKFTVLTAKVEYAQKISTKNVLGGLGGAMGGGGFVSTSTGPIGSAPLPIKEVVVKTNEAIKDTNSSLGVLGNTLKPIAGYFAAAFSVYAIIDFGKSIVEVERKMELLQNRINFVFDSANAGSLAFSRLRKMSIDLGIEFSSLAEGFASFGIASKMAGFSASDTEKVFGRIAVGLRAAGAGSLQTQRAFYALQQMLSKGVVAAEELRRQLGEALPGASDLMTRAYNRLHPEQELTNRQFTKMLEEGKIISKEILPEFSKVIEEVFAPALSGKQNSLDASIQRTTTQLERFKQSLANFLPTKTVFNVLSDFFDDLNTMMEAGFLNFTKLAALAASGNVPALSAEIERLRAIRELEQMQAEKDEAQLQKRIEERAQMYLKQGVTSQKAISGETDRIKEQRKELKELIDQLEKLEAVERKSNKFRLEGQYQMKPLLKDQGLKDKEDPLKAVQNQKALIAEKKKEIEFTQRLINEISRLGQQREETEGPKSIAAAKERIALEETRLLATTEGTAAYYTQLIKVIDARKELVKLEKAETPNEMGLDLAKLDKDLNKAKKMIQSFTPEMADIVEEGVYVPSVDALERLSKEIRDITKQQLEDRAAAIQTEIQFHKEGTDTRLELEKQLVMAKARLAAKDAEIQGKSVKEIEAIFAKANIEMADLDKKFHDNKRKEAEDYADFYKRLQDGLDGYESNSLQRRLNAIRQYYGELIAEAKVYGRTKGEIDKLAANRDKAIFEENLKEVGKFVNTASSIYGQFTQIQQMEYDNQKAALDNKLAQGLISEEQYNAQVIEIEKRRFEQNKQTQKLEVLINTASAVVRAFADLGPIGGALAAFALGAMAIKQIGIIDSAQFPQAFKEGVIDLKGPGTETSDSIPARLSRGESVMTADETRRYKPVLQAIRDNEFEAFVAKRYTDAMRNQRSGDRDSSFAKNLSTSMELNSVEMIDAIRKNKSVKIANWDDFGKMMNKPRTAHKIHRRRAW